MRLSIEQRTERDSLLSSGLKKCTHCGQVLLISGFSKDSKSPTRLASWCKICKKAWRSAHREQRTRYNLRYRRRRGDESLVHRRRYLRQWRKEHPEENRKQRRNEGNRRRAQLAGLTSTLTESQWEYAIAWFGGRCAYCGVTGVPLHQEHVVALSAGGGHVASNIIPACNRCNASKRDRPLEAWAASYGRAFMQDGAVENTRAFLVLQM